MEPQNWIWRATAPLEAQTALACWVGERDLRLGRLYDAARQHLDPQYDRAFIGYQAEVSGVENQAFALYAAVRAREIRYENAPGPAEDEQRVASADEVLRKRVGCCADLALLLAGLLRRAELNPLIVVVGDNAAPNHALLGYWKAANGEVSDPDRHLPFDEDNAAPQPLLTESDIRSHMSELEFLDPTAVCDQQAASHSKSFRAAKQAGKQLITETLAPDESRSQRIWYAVDVQACRRLKVPSISSRRRARVEIAVTALALGFFAVVLIAFFAFQYLEP